MKTRNKVLATVIASLVSASSFGATTDSSPGSTSTGNVDINLQVLDSFEISSLTVSSANAKFSLVGGLGNEIDYMAKLAGTAGGAAAAATEAYNSITATFAGSSVRECGSSDNASVDVSITEAEIRSASADTYDTLTLLVNPI